MVIPDFFAPDINLAPYDSDLAAVQDLMLLGDGPLLSRLNLTESGAELQSMICEEYLNPVRQVFAADMDADSRKDLILSSGSSNQMLVWKQNLGAGNFGKSQAMFLDWNMHGIETVEDLNQDGFLDILQLAAPLNFGLSTLQFTEGPQWHSPESVTDLGPVGYNQGYYGNLDIDGDGLKEFVFNGQLFQWNESHFQTIHLLEENYDKIIGTMDVDNNGLTDFLLTTAWEGDKGLGLILQVAPKIFEAGDTLFTSLQIDDCVVEDFDLDGNKDLLVYNRTEGRLAVYLLNSSMGIREYYPFAQALDITLLQIADLNGDTFPDIVCSVRDYGQYRDVLCILNTGYSLEAGSFIERGADFGRPLLFDADQDGLDDLLLLQEEKQSLALYLNQEQAPSSESLTFDIYPNPASQILHLDERALVLVSSIRVLDLHGREVLSSIPTTSLSISHLPLGLYLLALDTEEGVRYERFLVQ